MRVPVLIIMGLIGPILPAQTGADPIEVTGGAIEGTIDRGVRAYLGIPFAAAPTGEGRWKPPRPPADWDGVRDCSRYGPICPQPPYPKDSIYYRELVNVDEDCLNLNVWTDARSPTDGRPVMVWIHGGALTRGSGSHDVYNGASLAKKGVVVVTINYRLGPLGFLAHPELSAESERGVSGNYGFLDQIAALQWVKNNIMKFGGDPDRVTLFGESAGSLSVNVLTATPLAAGLFHRAIGQSGASFRSMTHLKSGAGDEAAAEAVGEAFIKACGAASIAEARMLDVARIIDVFADDPEGKKFQTRAVVDGWVLPDEIRNLYAAGKHHKTPLMVGSNADEMTTLAPRETVPTTLEALKRRVKVVYGEAADRFFELYPSPGDAQAGRAYLDGLRDRAFTEPMRAWARAAAKTDMAVYRYYFTRIPPNPAADDLRAYHAAEIAYAFDNLDFLPRNYEEIDRRLADIISSYWVNFASTGDPNGVGLPIWEPYDETHEQYQQLGDEVLSGHKLLKAHLDFHESVDVGRWR